MPATKLTDDLGRTLVFVHPPQRIVSLVPSDTHNLVALGAADRLVGRTAYCTSPEAAHLPVVGGTKDVDIEAVCELTPQLVVANQEENTRSVLEALAARGVPLLVSLPRRVSDGIGHLARLARLLGLGDQEPARSLIRRGYQLGAPTDAGKLQGRPRDATPPMGEVVVRTARDSLRAFVPIWMDPLMTLNADTYGSDVLARVGISNVFGDRLRLYPLAADLGKIAPQDAAGRDVRYPRVTIQEVVARKPQLVILPDEPHLFTADDEALFARALPDARIVRVDGKDLFWYGAWTIDALDRLAVLFARSS